jgi:hypothetical protein
MKKGMFGGQAEPLLATLEQLAEIEILSAGAENFALLWIQRNLVFVEKALLLLPTGANPNLSL